MRGKPSTHTIRRASLPGRARLGKSQSTDIASDWKRLKDGKGKEKGKREPRQTFQSQKEMDKDNEELFESTVLHDG